MVSLFLLLGCNLSYIVDLFAALHELASASARTLLKLASSVRALIKPYGDTLNFGLKPQVGGIKIVTVYKRSIFQVEWLIATLIGQCGDNCKENLSLK